MVFFIIFCLLRTAEAGSINVFDTAREFIERIPLAADERSYLLENIPSVSDVILSSPRWVTIKDEMIYSFVMTPVRKSENPNMQNRLQEIGRRTSQMRANCLLYLHAISPERKMLYQSKDALGEALIEWDRAQRLRVNFSVVLISESWAFAVSRTSREALDMLSNQLNNMEESFMDKIYCNIRIPQARELFKQEHYTLALPIYQEIREKRNGVATDYYDLAECFLHTGDTENAVKVAEETLAGFGKFMDSYALERGADIFFESGAEELALRYYLEAIEKLHKESPYTQQPYWYKLKFRLI